MKDSKSFLESQKKEIIELQRLLTSIPAIAPEGGGEGETKKADALEKWLKENGFENILKWISVY